eukprot:364353-Chlamydomonas_euryale.AAC.2
MRLLQEAHTAMMQPCRSSGTTPPSFWPLPPSQPTIRTHAHAGRDVPPPSRALPRTCMRSFAC